MINWTKSFYVIWTLIFIFMKLVLFKIDYFTSKITYYFVMNKISKIVSFVEPEFIEFNYLECKLKNWHFIKMNHLFIIL